MHPGILGYSTQMYTKNSVYAHAGKHKPAAHIAIDLMYLLARVSRPSYEFSTAVAVLDTPLPPPMDEGTQTAQNGRQ